MPPPSQVFSFRVLLSRRTLNSPIFLEVDKIIAIIMQDEIGKMELSWELQSNICMQQKPENSKDPGQWVGTIGNGCLYVSVMMSRL